MAGNGTGHVGRTRLRLARLCRRRASRPLAPLRGRSAFRRFPTRRGIRPLDAQAMAMTFWLPQTEAVLAQVEGR